MSFVFAFQSKMGNSQFISLLTYGFDDTVLPSDHVNINFRNYMDNFSAAEKQWKATGVPLHMLTSRWCRGSSNTSRSSNTSQIIRLLRLSRAATAVTTADSQVVYSHRV